MLAVSPRMLLDPVRDESWWLLSDHESRSLMAAVLRRFCASLSRGTAARLLNAEKETRLRDPNTSMEINRHILQISFTGSNIVTDTTVQLTYA